MRSDKSNRILDELSCLMMNALGLAKGLRRELEVICRCQIERFLNRLDLVPREEFDVVKLMVSKVRIDHEELKERIKGLEARLEMISDRK
ncbi:MAG: hypothetical protein JSC161_000699 [Candidatus Tokpelaia sp. JSC161]|jgi:hypothetical protein|nr:MAG: hypothetical protein JSC161_000699 [Candidatus Tokpelaia sp. JSC161]